MGRSLESRSCVLLGATFAEDHKGKGHETEEERENNKPRKGDSVKALGLLHDVLSKALQNFRGSEVINIGEEALKT